MEPAVVQGPTAGDLIDLDEALRPLSAPERGGRRTAIGLPYLEAAGLVAPLGTTTERRRKENAWARAGERGGAGRTAERPSRCNLERLFGDQPHQGRVDGGRRLVYHFERGWTFRLTRLERFRLAAVLLGAVQLLIWSRAAGQLLANASCSGSSPTPYCHTLLKISATRENLGADVGCSTRRLICPTVTRAIREI